MPQASLQESLGQIAGLARTGRLQEASLLAARCASAAGQDPVFHSLAGAVEFHRGEFAGAAAYLEIAQRQLPGDLTVRANLAEALYRCGRGDDAYVLCDETSALADHSLRLARLGGHLAQELEDYARAAELYRLVIEAEPRDWSVWNNLGNALSALEDHDAAAAALEKAAALAPDSQPIKVNLGNALRDAGRYEEARDVLRQAADTVPDDPNPQMALFALYTLTGLEDEAFAAIAEAARRAPGRGDIQGDFGQEAVRRNHYDLAERAFEDVLRIDPNDAQAFVGLATVYERVNREAELDPLRERAGGAGEEALAFIDALRFKRADRMDDAYAALERAGDVVAPGRTHHLRGVILDRIGRHDEAFAEFVAMNEHWKADPVRPQERAREYRSAVAQATARLTPAWIAGWSAANPAIERPAPIFLLGFPRSGTTLLDTMLMSDPKVRVLEEEPIIGEIERDFGGMDALPGLDEAAIAAAREAYFERAGRIVELSPGTRIVDKHPLHGNKAEVIARLFPEARYIVALRHPCDVLLSCFLTNFRNNHAMANFLDLEDAAEVYDLSFAHWQRAQQVLGLQTHTVVYERLVEDTERELRPLFDWLGLDWPTDRFDHTEAARARGMVSTASYAQVTEAVYTRAAGRWQRYADHLAPILPRLQPWVDRFGYSLEDGRYPDWSDVAEPVAP